MLDAASVDRPSKEENPTNPGAAQAGALPGNETTNTSPSFEYPKNINGDPEFASVLVTLDHLLQRHPFHVMQKTVYSTQDVEEALLGLMDYYGLQKILTRPSTLDMLVRNRQNPWGSIFIMTVPVGNIPAHAGHVQDPNSAVSAGIKVEVLLSTPCLFDVINHPDLGKGSYLLAVNWLVEMASTFLEASKAQLGAYPPLNLFQLEPGIIQQPVAPEPPAVADDGPVKASAKTRRSK